jgi:hypothetical protein
VRFGAGYTEPLHPPKGVRSVIPFPPHKTGLPTEEELCAQDQQRKERANRSRVKKPEESSIDVSTSPVQETPEQDTKTEKQRQKEEERLKKEEEKAKKHEEKQRLKEEQRKRKEEGITCLVIMYLPSRKTN